MKTKPKIILIMLQTINGKIAQNAQDRLDWGGKKDKANFAKISKDIGIMIMGSKTFDAMGKKALPNRHTIVMTRSPEKYADISGNNVVFSSKEPVALVKELEEKYPRKDQFALVGGGTINAKFLEAGLISHIYLTIAPQIFTTGKNIFDTEISLSAALELQEYDLLDNNTIFLKYKLVK